MKLLLPIIRFYRQNVSDTHKSDRLHCPSTLTGGKEESEVDLDDYFRDFLEDYLPRWGIITQDPVNEASVFENFEDPEIRDRYKEWVDDEDAEATTEESLAYLAHGMSWAVEEGAEAEVMKMFKELFGFLLAQSFRAFSEEELEPLSPVFHKLESMSDEELRLAHQYTIENWHTQRHLTVAQHTEYLSTELLSSEMVNQIEDAKSAQAAIEIFRKCMEICDAGSPYVLGIKRISEGQNPTESDLASMPLGARINEFRESEFRPVTRGVDVDIRNAIAHGDFQINPVSEEFEVASEGDTIGFGEFRKLTKKAVLSAKITGSFQVPVMYIVLERGLY